MSFKYKEIIFKLINKTHGLSFLSYKCNIWGIFTLE